MIDKNSIKIYNSLTNSLEDFKTITPNVVTMYVCGPTVYNHQHIGNGRPVVFFDTVKRFFKYLGFEVKHVSNFTDIDDKIIKRAKEEGITEKEVAEKYIDSFIEANELLNCEMDVVRPRVTENMQGILDFIDRLVKNGNAYVSGDDVYFRVNSCDKYGCLSNQKLDDLDVGSRIEVNTGKEDPRDFTLWKKTSDDGIKWPSNYGDGRPGWHTECVVMIHNLLGEKIDIHGGGTDLKFPHHENENAQNYCLNHDMLANFWVHNARVDLKGEKMSKSLGNVIWIKDMCEKHHPMAFRLLILSNHYRQNISYDESLMVQMEGEYQKIVNSYTSLYRKLELQDKLAGGEVLPIMDDFLKCMAWDFNSSTAIVSLYDLLKKINVDLRNKNTDIKVYQDEFKTLSDMLYILGIYVKVQPLTDEEKDIIKKWYAARDAKDFAQADFYRNQITERGIKL